MSEKARGKKRTLEPQREEDDVNDLGMDLDDSGSEPDQREPPEAIGEERVDGQRGPSKRKNSTSSNASTPSTSASASTAVTGIELGGSVSRAARMRATTTEDEGGSGSESASGDSEMSDSNRLLNTPSRSVKKQRGPSKGFVTASNGEAYLRAMSRPAKTSNKKLSESWSSSHGVFSQGKLLAALQAASSGSKAQGTEGKVRELERAYITVHDQWAFELEQGFSVFLYGIGSKAQVVQDFVDMHLRKRPGRRKGQSIVINGFMASMGIDEVLAAFEEVVLGETLSRDELTQLKLGKSAAKLDERARGVVEAMSRSEDAPIHLIVNNIDGIALRSFRSQAILSFLASQKQVRLLATIDHVKAPLLFSSSLAAARGARQSDAEGDSTLASLPGYSIIYHHTPTFRSYTREALHSGVFASFPPTLFASDKASHLLNGMDGQSSEARAKAAYFVLASLTQKSKDVFSLLAERQIASSAPSYGKRATSMKREKAPPHATPYASLFSLARDRFLANNVNQFEALLREFRDHDVLLSSNTAPEDAVPEEGEAAASNREEVGQRSDEWIWIAIEMEELAELLERLQN